jgi:single-strand selective monofunctional uracil DNA glycosylase
VVSLENCAEHPASPLFSPESRWYKAEVASRTKAASKTNSSEQVAQLISITQRLSTAVDRLRFDAPVTHVYNPLAYAWEPHESYLRRYGAGENRAILLGMNPGPFGMAQVGVPFGEVSLVRDWLQVNGVVSKPKLEHPARPIQGFDCTRSEVSGARLWGWAKDRFVAPERFFEKYFVVNYCPLVFMGDSGKNVTPDKLPPAERKPLFEVCDRALAELCDALSPRMVIGVGTFALGRAKEALEGRGISFGQILHPSPASPKANAGWAKVVEQQLQELGL